MGVVGGYVLFNEYFKKNNVQLQARFTNLSFLSKIMTTNQAREMIINSIKRRLDSNIPIFSCNDSLTWIKNYKYIERYYNNHYSSLMPPEI